MTDNIIGFRPKREELAMECAYCGFQGFLILNTGYIECMGCETQTKITQLAGLLINTDKSDA